ncbi:MAG: CDP-diacylglycerol--glycerol-3-phosphate 3-phosphatidyltransferase [Alphaproteobacteria bacterium]
MRHLPNVLTLFRLLSAPVLAALLCGQGAAWQAWAAFALFAVAALTDHLDGFLARRLRAESAWGRQLDPMADKLLIAAGLLGLAVPGMLGGVHLVPVGVILIREVLICGVREWLALRSAELPVTPLARLKTTAQAASVGLLLIAPLTDGMAPSVFAAGLGALWAAAALTLYTGALYLRRTRGLLRRSVGQVS